MLALGRASAVTITLAAAVSLYALASLAATKAETGACERELAALERSVAELEDENARLRSQTESGLDVDTAERLARQRLGLAYPEDIIFLSGVNELHTGG